MNPERARQRLRKQNLTYYLNQDQYLILLQQQKQGLAIAHTTFQDKNKNKVENQNLGLYINDKDLKEKKKGIKFLKFSCRVPSVTELDNRTGGDWAHCNPTAKKLRKKRKGAINKSFTIKPRRRCRKENGVITRTKKVSTMIVARQYRQKMTYT